MSKPTSKHYIFEQLISQNNICQAWQAISRTDDTRVFVKTPSPQTGLNADQLTLVLTASYAQQQGLSGTNLLLASRKRIDGGRLFIEYPFLRDDAWQPLTATLLAKHAATLLPEICLTVDYLHQMGRVHGDLKLENFMVSKEQRPARVLLSDLDLLRGADSPADSMLFGTPGHIAPEIRDNQRVLVQSDNFSLGVSLKHALEVLAGNQGDRPSWYDGLAAAADELVNKDFLKRPRLLLDLLRRHGLFVDSAYDQLVLKLWTMILISRFRRSDRSRLTDPGAMSRLLRDRCRAIGLQDDLIAAMSRAYGFSRRATLRAFRDLVERGKVTPAADYWHIAPDDEALTAAYAALEAIVPPDDDETVPVFATRQLPAGDLLERIAELRDAGEHERAYLALKRCVGRETSRSAPSGEVKQVWETRAELARSLRRLEDAESDYVRLVESARDQVERLRWLLTQIEVRIERKDIAGVKELIEVARHIPESPETVPLRRTLRRLHAWLQMAEGSPENAVTTLETLIDECRAIGDHDVLVLSLYNVGVVHLVSWGDYRRCEEYVLESLKLARQFGLEHRCVRAATTLGLLYNDLSLYTKAIKHCKTAIRHATQPEHIPLLPTVYGALSTALARTGEFDKAEFWLQQKVAAERTSAAPADMYHALAGLGHLRLLKCQLREAVDTVARAVEIAGSERLSPRSVGRTYHSLCLAALYMGDTTRLHQYLEECRRCFQQQGGDTALAGVQQTRLEAEICYQKKPRTRELIDHAAALLRARSPYYAARAVFWLLLDGSPEALAAARETARGLGETLDQTSVPLFDACTTLLDGIPADSPDNVASDEKRKVVAPTIHVTAWKKAMATLNSGYLRFEALQVALKIAEQYRQQNKPQWARKFYQQAQRQAEALDNEFYQKRAAVALEEMARIDVGTSRLVRSMHEISLLMRDLPDYQTALDNLIRFAVDQSGAERGVLLLRADTTSGLYVASSLNCDDQSLTDIADFSTSVPDVAIEELEPLVIENAITDNRTRRYKSVAFHNIMSVACVPLIDGDRALGALYLDHHSIPALFTHDDIVYIRSVANFITVALRAAQQYRNLDLHNIELRRRLSQAGADNRFLTRNQSMREMLGKLKEVARTNSSILLIGDSGTGKEVLADMIYENSLRVNQPFVKLNCAAISRDMIEAELFGIAARAATGVEEREGKFGAANGGTLFLDEIGDMPIDIQAKVLRVVDRGEFTKVGSNRPIQADIRFLYATNRNLEEMIAAGTFREDLYYRIKTIEVHVSPLRERPEDVAMLLEHYVKQFSRHSEPPAFSRETIEILARYHWPGNVRELKNMVERFCILKRGQRVTPADLTDDIRRSAPVARSQVKSDNDLSAERIKEVLTKHRWNRSATARELRLPVSTLRRWIKKFGLEPPPTP